MRLPWVLALTMCASTVAHAACVPMPMSEGVDALADVFMARMRLIGIDDWVFTSKTSQKSEYFSKHTGLRLAVEKAGDAVRGLRLFLPADRIADGVVQMETAATFLAAHLSGAPETDLKSRIVRAVVSVRNYSTGQAVREGNTILIFSSPEPGAVVLEVTQLRCP